MLEKWNYCHIPDKSWVGCIIGFDPEPETRKPEPCPYIFYPAFRWDVARKRAETLMPHFLASKGALYSRKLLACSLTHRKGWTDYLLPISPNRHRYRYLEFYTDTDNRLFWKINIKPIPIIQKYNFNREIPIIDTD